MAWTGEALDHWIAEAPRLWLFLDYDGTLAEFSRTPDIVNMEPEVVDLVRGLAANPRARVAVISGRTLKIIQSLLPVEGIFMAGVYGVEMRPPEGEMVHRENYRRIRPFLDEIKPAWQALIAGKPDFFLEDKGWTLAIHADKAEPGLARQVLTTARESVQSGLPRGVFRWFLDDVFLELAPTLAHKGKTVGYMYSHFPLPEARLLYIGDDDKDEEAFQTVHAFGGVNILVSRKAHPFHSGEVDYIIDSPATVRRWLQRLLVPSEG